MALSMTQTRAGLVLLVLLLSIAFYVPALTSLLTHSVSWQEGDSWSFGVPMGQPNATTGAPPSQRETLPGTAAAKDQHRNKRNETLNARQRQPSSPVKASPSPSTGGIWFKHDTQAGDATQLNRTKIVGFINEGYKHVGMRWYDRLTALGYTEHVIIATDNATTSVFETEHPQYRIEAAYRPMLPKEFWTLKFGQKMRKEVEMLFAHRWVYLLEQLKAGYHVLITDVDNIFSKYHPMSDMELSEFDVFHALETKHPANVFEAMGFVVCGGMGWFRSSPSTIQFIQLMVDRCGDRCDDQVVLNSILAFDLGMHWNLTDWHKSFRTTNKNNTRMDGLLKKSFTGVSNTTGHKVKLWDQEFAYRGANDPDVCPINNWVSMPFVIFVSRWEGGNAKYKSYDIWDSYCPNEYSNMTTTAKGRRPSESAKI